MVLDRVDVAGEVAMFRALLDLDIGIATQQASQTVTEFMISTTNVPITQLLQEQLEERGNRNRAKETEHKNKNNNMKNMILIVISDLLVSSNTTT